MTESQMNTRNQVFSTLENLASSEMQINYKKAVPFVDIPGELLCQWGTYSSRKEVQWFKDSWNQEEWKIFLEFDTFINQKAAELPELTPDIPEIFGYAIWLEIMELAQQTL